MLRTLLAMQALPCFREYLEEVRAVGEGEARVLGEDEGRAARARDAGMARLERELARLASFARQEVETGVLELGAEVWELPGKEGVGGGKSLAQQLVERGKAEADKKVQGLKKQAVAEVISRTLTPHSKSYTLHPTPYALHP